MDSYQAGVLVGQILFWVLLFTFFWGIVKLYKKIFEGLFNNKTQKLLKEYLLWVDFIQDIKSIDELKKQLQKIKSKKVYKDKNNHFYLTHQEAKAQNIDVNEIAIKEVLNSQTYLLFLIKRLEEITIYDTKDLKSITETSKMVWTVKKEIVFHMIIDNEKLIYPKEYPQDNSFRFGYEVFYYENGLLGVYDIENEKLTLDFQYKYISTFANIVEVSKDNITYEIYDLETNELLESNNKQIFPHISNELKDRINLSKIELKDYLKLFDTPTSQLDLINMKLWGAKVSVMKIPSGYDEIIEDSSIGTIEWNHYSSADIYDMSIQLPVNFKKKNGEYVSIGINHEYLELDAEYRKKLSKLNATFSSKNNVKNSNKINSFEDLLIRGNLPDDNRIVPNWLKIKNRQFNDVDFSNNKVDEIVKLTSDEFNELVTSSDNGLLFTWLTTLNKNELKRFYRYNDEVVKLANNAEQSAREQFENAMAKIDIDKITDEQRARATLEMPLMINFAKNIYKTINEFLIYSKLDYYNYTDEEKYIRFESTLSSIIYEEMKYIPEYFKQIITHFKDFYDESNDEHKKIFEHLTNRFGYLIFALDKLIELTENKTDMSLHWFVLQAADKELISTKIEMSVDEINALKSDKKLINFLTLLFISICAKNDDAYLQSLINVTNTLFEYYPVNRKACEYAMIEMMKSVALKEVNVENANAFLSFFEELPRFYKVLSYEKIIELKELINYTLDRYKPLDNKIFNENGVKNKLILLNYKIDMEDLYYGRGKDVFI